MGFRKDAWATCWGVEVKSDTLTQVRISTRLIDGNGFCVNGKSLLGAMATVEWKSLYCESENDIYTSISKYCVE